MRVSLPLNIMNDQNNFMKDNAMITIYTEQ